MNIVDRMNRIRRRAYEIWESEGRPQGRHMIHWLRAESEIREIPITPQDLHLPASPPKQKAKQKSAPSKPAAKSSRRRP